MLCLSTLYYAWLAYAWRRRPGATMSARCRPGISVPHMFIVTFVIMLPIAAQRPSDPVQALGGGPDLGVHPELRADDRRLHRPIIRQDHAARGAARHAGRRLDHVHLDAPALQMFMTPVIGVVCFAIILVSWFGGVRYSAACRPAWWRSLSGTLIAWGSTAFGLNYGDMTVQG